MRRSTQSGQWAVKVLCGVAALVLLTSAAKAQTKAPPKPDFPKHADVFKGYEKVVSTADGKKSLYTIWTRKKDSQMYAELPASYTSQKYFLALTVSSGERFAGLQAGDQYFYWRRFDKRLAMIAPNIDTRSNGDAESKASVKRLFTDRVMLDVPIVTLGPGGGPVIDMDALLVGQASTFFGSKVRSSNRGLHTIKKAKAFPGNVELAFELPTSSGRLQTLHYSFSVIAPSSSYKPRKADERVGYFTTSYTDLGKYSDDDTRIRFVNRWHLEKADPKLKISPPKNPIVFYIEHTTPIRYRRWVREGLLSWNAAFEKVGLSNAIEVYYQDAKSGAHMEKDPEDVRYNFLRWLNNDIGTAIGPSRVNPTTGQILDADIILTDGWIRHYNFQFEDLLPRIAMESFGPETLSWLATHPNWDPRVRLAAPAQRNFISAQIAARANLPFGGHAATQVDSKLIGDDIYDGLIGRTSQVNGMCLAADGMAFDVAVMRAHLELISQELAQAEEKADDKKDGEKKKDEKKKDEKPKKPEETKIDGMPESFVGPLLAHLVAHEVGHTLGLRHNFKGSSTYTLAEINSDKLKGKKPLASSVMDYTAVNMNFKGGKVQGDYTMIGIGGYDYWAIEYGYSFAKDLKPILDRVAEPELQYGTDEDTSGPDPLARRYDFSKNPLEYANNQTRLANYHRKQIVDKFVKDGQSWSRARRGYDMTINLQFRAVSMMGNWIGGVHVYRDKKGDKNGRPPFEVVPAEKQRAALKFVIENSLRDEAFGLTPELLKHMTTDKWFDGGGFALSDSTWPIHDRIMGMQSSALTMVMNPTTLRRVYDNELRVPANQDMITLPEILDTLDAAIWTEFNEAPKKKFTARQPMVSSLRRNLQREYLTRLIDLSMPGAGSTAVYKPIADLARMELKDLRGRLTKTLEAGGDKIDPYTKAHLVDDGEQIARAMDATYIYNTDKIGGRRSFSSFFHGQKTEAAPQK